MVRNSLRIICVLGAALMAACSGGNKAKVTGRFDGREGVVYLEKVGVGRSEVVDSATLKQVDGKAGEFSFAVELAQGQPAMYNIRSGKDFIPLLLAAGDDAKLTVKGGDMNEYTVSGSPDSERMRELKEIMRGGAAKMDEIRKMYQAATDDQERGDIATTYLKEYNKAKQRQIEFIVSQPSSLVSLYALYQRFPNDNTLYQGETDIVYYRMVADSVGVKYPDSPLLKSLQKELASTDSRSALMQRLSSEFAAASGSALPDLNLPDVYGNKHKLSECWGDVVLLDFWTAEQPGCISNNEELKERYDDWAERGLKIYQVSTDTERAIWVTAVLDQRLPWTSVCDLRGAASHSAMAYNVWSVPMNYLIGRDGKIVARNIYGEPLYRKIDQLLAQ